MVHGVRRTCLLVLATLVMAGCQNPTDPSSVVSYDEAVDIGAAPDPIIADTSTGGRTYRIVRGNNQPDDILPYDWHTVFSATVSFNNNATDKDVDLEFPIKIASTTLTVKQASGGIVTPPTGSDTEKFEFITLNATGNQLPAVSSPVSLSFEVWYDLPSLRREAVVALTFTFVDNNNVSFQKAVDLKVAP